MPPRPSPDPPAAMRFFSSLHASKNWPPPKTYGYGTDNTIIAIINTTLNKLRMLQCFIGEQTFLNISLSHQP